MPEATYTIVRDQGGNIGLLCPICGQARWTESHDAKDWATGNDCPNCDDIRKNKDVFKEQEKERIFKKTQEEIEKKKKDIDEADTKKKKDKIKAKAMKKAQDEVAQEQGLDDEIAEIETP